MTIEEPYISSEAYRLTSIAANSDSLVIAVPTQIYMSSLLNFR
jgi:hypothetical protein